MGAIVGGFLFEKLRLEVVPDFWGNLITATIGAIVFLLIWRAIRKA
ncbi:MAG: GlsB/YeaQ/YmgE family stress response membrane protein [Pseudolabrys sp.]